MTAAAQPATLPRHTVQHPDGRWFDLYGDVPASTADGITSAAADSGFDPTPLHRRFDRLTGAWVLVSPARNVRPSAAVSGGDAPSCPLCPGGPELPGPFALAVFDNRFPSLSPLAPEPDGDDELVARSGGRCRVVVYTDRHIANLGELADQQLADVVAVWRDQSNELWAAGHEYVMAFENHGNAVGATLPHLHGQIYAFDHLPPTIVAKLAAVVDHRRRTATCLGCTLVADDVAGDRVVTAGEHFVAAAPFAARWPLEVHIRARGHGVGRLGDLDDDAALELASIVRDVVGRYDRLWGFELPYLMCVQEAPAGCDGDWHLHVELLPPHRNSDRLKVRASVETALGVFINDTDPEATVARLREVGGERRRLDATMRSITIGDTGVQ